MKRNSCSRSRCRSREVVADDDLLLADHDDPALGGDVDLPPRLELAEAAADVGLLHVAVGPGDRDDVPAEVDHLEIRVPLRPRPPRSG